MIIKLIAYQYLANSNHLKNTIRIKLQFNASCLSCQIGEKKNKQKNKCDIFRTVTTNKAGYGN